MGFISYTLGHVLPYIIIICIIEGFILRKIDNNPLMRLNPIRDNPGTDMVDIQIAPARGVIMVGDRLVKTSVS